MPFSTEPWIMGERVVMFIDFCRGHHLHADFHGFYQICWAHFWAKKNRPICSGKPLTSATVAYQNDVFFLDIFPDSLGKNEWFLHC